MDNSISNPDLHLQSTSPAINAGNPALVPEGVDMDDQDRINQGRVDIGADEYYITTSVFNSEKLQDMLCYPNPTNGKVNIDVSENFVQQITVVDLAGRVIVTKTAILQNSTIDLSGLKNGIYVVRVQTNNEVLTTKIIKE